MTKENTYSISDILTGTVRVITETTLLIVCLAGISLALAVIA